MLSSTEVGARRPLRVYDCVFMEGEDEKRVAVPQTCMLATDDGMKARA